LSQRSPALILRNCHLIHFGKEVSKHPIPSNFDWVGVKAPQFSFFRISDLGQRAYLRFYRKHGLEAIKVYKFHEEKEPNIKTLLENKKLTCLSISLTIFLKRRLKTIYD